MDAEFSISPQLGLLPGGFRVEITASRPTGKQFRDLVGNMVTLEEQYIPAKYNTESKLEAEIGDDGSCHLEFVITSK